MAKAKKQPVLLGSLKPGDWFTFDSKIWEVVRKDPPPSKAKLYCKKINSPVDRWIDRTNYVLPASVRML